MKTIRLITCSNAAQAHILQGALANEGIDSVLHNENFSSLLVGFVDYISGVDILVDEEDYAEAIRVLKRNQAWPDEFKLCPYCGSSNIKFVLKKKNRIRAIGAAVFAALAPFLRERITGNTSAGSATGTLKCLCPNFLCLRKMKNYVIN
ncbi:hypothetical protein JCM10512_1330 [Bacteroides reticulotermitis JCM 10512]|uniref:DUF2007 domain-containing protein n=1 Tax=Bacteroides reticulotermitis JCM 10512 TaxID=1445607 RepID=W4UQJ0_9BACE|nr:hypothetical protein JCM10512_1330 [Bacteroides reticulotermitis JCM 10512]